jgi:hypothetical protein
MLTPYVDYIRAGGDGHSCQVLIRYFTLARYRGKKRRKLECNETVLKLLLNFKRVFYSIIIEFGTTVKLIRQVKKD